MKPIYHIVEKAEWERAKQAGSYQPKSFVSEGFIHCSQANQVDATAGRYYRGRTDLFLLEVDEALVQSEVRYELAPIGELFPHIYGALNLDAVVRVLAFDPDTDGLFHFLA